MQENSNRLMAAVSAWCIGLLVTSLQSGAAEMAYGIDVGAGHSDNIGRTSQAQQDETIASVGTDFKLNQETTRLDAQISSRLEYRDYLDDTFDSEVIGSLVGNAKIDIIKERLTWALEDTFGQVTRDQFSPVTPGNRENVNYLTTGPNFTLPLTSRFDLIAQGRYSDVYYEDSDLGNERLRGSLALEREISAASNASINVSVEQVEFDDPMTFVDYDREEAFLHYGLQGARTTVGLDAGYAILKQAGESNDGFLARLNISRRVSESSTVSADIGHEFSDAGNIFRQLESSGTAGTATQPVQQVANPFENNYAVIRWTFVRNRSSMSLRGGYFDEQYENQPTFDRQRIDVDLSVQRSLSRALSIRAGGTYSRQNYDELNRAFADVSGTAGLDWRLGRAAYMSFEYIYFDRGDDVSASEYQENQFWLRLGYAVGNAESSGAGSARGTGF